jgi:hypothetical protein
MALINSFLLPDGIFQGSFDVSMTTANKKIPSSLQPNSWRLTETRSGQRYRLASNITPIL